MRRTNRNNAICFESLEEALAKRSETYRHLDLLCGGWPCQDNSIAGNRGGLTGEKSGLWKDVARLLRVFLPRWFIGENVPGFLSVNDGKDFCAVIAELQEIGYGVSWRILDSQYFGVAQQRRRLFIVGRLGEPCPPEILFEQKSGGRNSEALEETKQPRGLCLSTRDGERQDPSTENLICSTIRANDDSCGHRGFEKSNLISYTLNTGKRGCSGTLWEETTIATLNTYGERAPARFSRGLDSPRGVVIGNAVTVNVAEWLGKRIMDFERLSQ